MFTGIIEKVGAVLSVYAKGESEHRSRVLRVATGFSDLAPGESVAVDGVCLTVTERHDSGEVQFFVSGETLDRSNLGILKQGSRVNLERALRLGDRLSGHWVQGHVDGLGRISETPRESEAGHELRVEIPMALSRYLVEKGSIALNGVSLTINRIEHGADVARLEIMLIPHTWDHTSFADLRAGDPVNVEVDVLAKYVESLCRR
jgi:riboflavin synthase